MNYSRRELLGLGAAGACAVAASVLLRDRAYARELPATVPETQGPGRGVRVLDARGAYDQSQADRIHNRSVERQIRLAGKLPAEVKSQVKRRLRNLRAGLFR